MRIVSTKSIYIELFYHSLLTVHCRQRRMDQRKRSHPSTSANTYWQIEKEEDPRTGSNNLEKNNYEVSGHLSKRRFSNSYLLSQCV